MVFVITVVAAISKLNSHLSLYSCLMVTRIILWSFQDK
ncbi:hypothetical protein ATORI0001_0291 [Lancefieldella rimae ATCC 49626]|uniref:Uncharacterized protein n=1 Tax=Lancefieldella rimae (strain ATCC 49626 / DSM 7090 / CCUG 31168 / NBRC 15546 / VPI D140H-11A) TaxID=553184 RepID=B9CP87_LANR4|nr:hypothetical protein ATORI0001_0291 [Lancefieldella rimae ATCC 49626]